MDFILPEVIITSSGTCCIHDTANGNLVSSYKINNIAPKTLSLIGDYYMIGADKDYPLIRVFMISKSKSESSKFPVPGIVSALTVCSRGIYCIAGIKENIYVWQISTGELINVINRHYQSISCARFTTDDSLFITGGKDGHVLVWVLSQVIGQHVDRDAVKPLYSWNNHSAEVTDIYAGDSCSRCLTTSLDMTCKIYELDSGILLSTVCMDVPLTAVTTDTLENFIFLGDSRGWLYRINTYERMPKEMHCNSVEKVQLQVHESKIISLCLSIDGSKILTASEDQTCKLWDIISMAFLLNVVTDGSVTNAFLALKPTPLRVKKGEGSLPNFYIRMFSQTIGSPEEPITDSAEKSEESPVDKRKYLECTIYPKKLELMHEGKLDEFYSNSVRPCPLVQREDVELAAYEKMFQEEVHSGSVNELKTINNQLYSYVLNNGLDNTLEMSED